MTLEQRIQELKTQPRYFDPDAEYSSEFLEWFYQNLYRERGFDLYPILYSVSLEPEYEIIRELCRLLINQKLNRHLSFETQIALCQDIKAWTVRIVHKLES